MEREKQNRYTGHPQQLYSLRRVSLDEGRAKGTSVLEVTTAGGLQADILPDTGMDIGQLRYRGINISYIGKNGHDSLASFSATDGEFVNSFPAGMLYTCGLRNVGPGCHDNGEWFPQHGRVHASPAEQVSGYTENDCFVISGIMREAALFGHNLELRRRIEIPIFGSEIQIKDTIENLSNRPEEFMLLYHFNFGYPMLSEAAKLVLPEGRITVPRTEYSKEGHGSECSFTPPVDGEEEQVFFHLLPKFRAQLDNEKLGIRAELNWCGDQLPILTQWRSMASGDYVLGLEPCNCYIKGRSAERDNRTLRVLKGFEMIQTEVTLRLSDFTDEFRV